MIRRGAVYAEELLRVVAPEDGGESPFGWRKDEPPPEFAPVSRRATRLRPERHLSPEKPSSENPTSELRHP